MLLCVTSKLYRNAKLEHTVFWIVLRIFFTTSSCQVLLAEQESFVFVLPTRFDFLKLNLNSFLQSHSSETLLCATKKHSVKCCRMSIPVTVKNVKSMSTSKLMFCACLCDPHFCSVTPGEPLDLLCFLGIRICCLAADSANVAVALTALGA